LLIIARTLLGISIAIGVVLFFGGIALSMEKNFDLFLEGLPAALGIGTVIGALVGLGNGILASINQSRTGEDSHQVD
jgi:hypothetical protein